MNIDAIKLGSKSRVAVDFDDTVFPFLPNFLPFINGYLGTSLAMSDISAYDLTNVFDISRTKLDWLFNSFIEYNSCAIGYLPIKGSVETLYNLSKKGVAVYIVTARSSSSALVTESYVNTWFPGLVTDIIYRDSFNSGASKMHVCNYINAACLIDDNPLNFYKPSTTIQTSPVLFGNYAWNTATNGFPVLSAWADFYRVFVHEQGYLLYSRR